MKNVCILVPKTAVIEAVADPHYMFNAVNEFMLQSGRPQLFNIVLAGLEKDIKLGAGAFTVHAGKLLNEVISPDLIILPALSGDMKEAIGLNETMLPWIISQYKQGAELASLCMGAFLLAATGLLDGKKCSTHWMAANEFRQMFPAVQLVDGLVITDDQGIYSSGGANSYWNLLLYIVEKYTDRDTAIMAAKYFAIDIDRNSQNAFTIFRGQKAHEDKAVLQAQEFIEQHYHDKISINLLADKYAIGRRSFERRFKKATHNTVIEYLQRVKIEAAKRDFENSRKNITEVMYDVGYTDSKAFRALFKKLTGLTPVEYRNKYQQQPARWQSLSAGQNLVA